MLVYDESYYLNFTCKVGCHIILCRTNLLRWYVVKVDLCAETCSLGQSHIVASPKGIDNNAQVM